jgi:hypothetical protein
MKDVRRGSCRFDLTYDARVLFCRDYLPPFFLDQEFHCRYAR